MNNNLEEQAEAEINPPKLEQQAGCEFVGEECTTHLEKLTKSKVRKRYWGVDKNGLRRWKYRLETKLSCNGLKDLPCQKPCQNLGEITFTNVDSQRTDQDMGISDRTNILQDSDGKVAELDIVT